MVSDSPLLIINSFSRLLKTIPGVSQDYGEYLHGIHLFSDDLFPRLTHLAAAMGYLVILVHHTSYNPHYDAKIPYAADLCQQLKGSWITLSSTPISPTQTDRKITFSYLKEIPTATSTQLRRITRSRQYYLQDGHMLISSSPIPPQPSR